MSETSGILQKAFFILECLAEKNEPMTLDEVHTKTGFSKSTAFRILNQLVRMSYIEKTNSSYQTSMKLISLARSALHSKRDIQDIIQPYMVELRDTYNETVNFAVWDGRNAIYFATQPSRHVFRIENQIGQALPFHSMAIGKVIAANLEWDAVEAILCLDGMPSWTEHTITHPDEFHRELEKIRTSGFAIDDEECYEGVKCLAVPIFNSGNTIFGGLSISGPATRLTEDVVEKMVKDLQITGYRISYELTSYDAES
jgi:DNA-binding IclR family transcriptional regulator